MKVEALKCQPVSWDEEFHLSGGEGGMTSVGGRAVPTHSSSSGTKLGGLDLSRVRGITNELWQSTTNGLPSLDCVSQRERPDPEI